MKRRSILALSNLSPTIRFLTASDAILTAALGLFGPIFAILIANQIQTNNALEVIGIGTSIFLFTRSLGQIPLAIIIDKIKGEKDDFWVLLTGSLIYVLVPLLYLIISEPWHLFTVQFIYGTGAAMTFPTWNAIFTRHIDKGKEGLEWGIYQTINDLAGAVAAPIGGFVASIYGFAAVMYFASGIAAISSFYILMIYNNLLEK